MKKRQYIVIVGCGRLGALLANRLSLDGHSIVVIDRNEEAFKNLSPDFSGFYMEGDATQMAALKKAKPEKADKLIATTREDNVNLMVAQVAQTIFKVPHVLTRIFDPKRHEIYAQMGIETICPISIAAERFMQAIGGRRNGGENAQP